MFSNVCDVCSALLMTALVKGGGEWKTYCSVLHVNMRHAACVGSLLYAHSSTVKLLSRKPKGLGWVPEYIYIEFF